MKNILTSLFGITALSTLNLACKKDNIQPNQQTQTLKVSGRVSGPRSSSPKPKEDKAVNKSHTANKDKKGNYLISPEQKQAFKGRTSELRSLNKTNAQKLTEKKAVLDKTLGRINNVKDEHTRLVKQYDALLKISTDKYSNEQKIAYVNDLYSYTKAMLRTKYTIENEFPEIEKYLQQEMKNYNSELAKHEAHQALLTELIEEAAIAEVDLTSLDDSGYIIVYRETASL